RGAVGDRALRARILAVDGRANGAAGAGANVGKVLDVLGDEEAARVEDKDAARLPTLAEDLLSAVGAEHAGADHHCVEGEPAVPDRSDRLVPGVADVPSLDVDREGRFLDQSSVWGFNQPSNHVVPHLLRYGVLNVVARRDEAVHGPRYTTLTLPRPRGLTVSVTRWLESLAGAAHELLSLSCPASRKAGIAHSERGDSAGVLLPL